MLAADVVLVSDGGEAVRAARHPVHGADRVTRFVSVIGPKVFDGADVQLAPVNGDLGFVVLREGTPYLAGTVEVADGTISTIRWVVNPDKLHWVGGAAAEQPGGGRASPFAPADPPR